MGLAAAAVPVLLLWASQEQEMASCHSAVIHSKYTGGSKTLNAAEAIGSEVGLRVKRLSQRLHSGSTTRRIAAEFYQPRLHSCVPHLSHRRALAQPRRRRALPPASAPASAAAALPAPLRRPRSPPGPVIPLWLCLPALHASHSTPPLWVAWLSPGMRQMFCPCYTWPVLTILGLLSLLHFYSC